MAIFQEGYYEYCKIIDEDMEEPIFEQGSFSDTWYWGLPPPTGGRAELGALEMCKGDDDLVDILSESPDKCMKKLKDHIDRVYKASPFREPEPTMSAASIGALPAERTQLSHLFAADG